MGTSTAFVPLFEVFALTVTLMIALQTTVAFGKRYLSRNRALLNLTGLLASFLSLFYTLWALTIWFCGIGGLSCTVIQVVNGMCLSSSNALAVVLVAVHTLLSGYAAPNTALGGEERCVWTFEEATFKLKWLVQLFNHILMAGLFVWPLLAHVRGVRATSLGRSGGGSSGSSGSSGGSVTKARSSFSRTSELWEALIMRAVVAMAISVTYCVIMTGLVIAKYDDPSLPIPVFALAILDNGVTLASIYYAVSVPCGSTTAGSGGGGGGGPGSARRRPSNTSSNGFGAAPLHGAASSGQLPQWSERTSGFSSSGGGHSHGAAVVQAQV
ncbi:hypothetical protein JKP88DRAFT_304047 [Tribonema minus]|uniref:Transmembrane protein n=1 Tax=Tribonema minus TaxID=303371 RepID=A0A835Z900_9STRA|nr:hypothetical protein JKP88DRAFT_304047 [Tribonema minus]